MDNFHINQIQTGCAECYFCRYAQCSFGEICLYTKQWSEQLGCFVPINYAEKRLKELQETDNDE